MKRTSRLFHSTLAAVLSLGMCGLLLADTGAATNTPPSRPACATCNNSRQCPTCQGSGQDRCSSCQGRGKDKDRCSICGGDGRVSKTTRVGGKTRRTTGSCSRCGGRGYKERSCSRCGGDGKVTCSKCGGNKTCPACQASRR